MKNEYKDMFDFLQDNKLGISSINIDILKKADLIKDKDILIKKITEINERYENNPSKYSEYIMQQLRMRIGLDDKYDTSEDEVINNMDKDLVFENLLGWNGLRGWDYIIKNWIKEIYGVEL